MPVLHPVNVFISYSHKDHALLEELDIQLGALKREGKIQVWKDGAIEPGQKWSDEITQHLESADIILLLISADFINSDYCYTLEMRRALERDQAGEARVIPILLRPADWQNSVFSHLQVLPTQGGYAIPITTWDNRDEAYVTVVQGIRRAVDTLMGVADQSSGQPQPSSPLVSPVRWPRSQKRKGFIVATILVLSGGLGVYLALPTLANHWFTQPGMKLVQEDWNAAEAKFQWAVRLNPNDTQAHFQLAKLYEARQELDKAQHHYQKAIRGDNLAAKNNLARLYLLGNNPSAAVNLLLQILKADASEPLPPEAKHSILKNLGWARLQQENGVAAAEQLEAAISLEAEHAFPPVAIANTHCLMAQVLEGQGEVSQALAYWQTCNENANITIPEHDEWAALAQKRITPTQEAP